MKNSIVSIVLLLLFTSCIKESINFNTNENNNYGVALDTLKNYDDYILGDFNDSFLVSTNVFSRSYSATSVSNLIDSSYIQFQLIYKLLDKNVDKSMFVTFRVQESKAKLDTTTTNIAKYYKYKHFSDFIDFFDRNTFDYYQVYKPNERVHSVLLAYRNHHETNNHLEGYYSEFYNQEISLDQFHFIVDRINIIENPLKKVEMYYSFKCIGVNSYGDELIINNGKGKSTFRFDL